MVKHRHLFFKMKLIRYRDAIQMIKAIKSGIDERLQLKFIGEFIEFRNHNGKLQTNVQTILLHHPSSPSQNVYEINHGSP